MTDAPERIWKADNTHPDGTREYIRADLAPDAALVAELVEALRKIADPKRSAMFNVREIARAALAKLEIKDRTTEGGE